MKRNPPDKEFLSSLKFEPVTRGNWHKLVDLFGPRGACGNCWCMYYRMSNSAFHDGKVDQGNKEALRELVWDNKPVGLLAVYEGQAIAWCAFAPREDFIRLERSRVHKRIDQLPVWSIPCFFVHKDFRRQGVTAELLKGVIQYAREKGIGIVEAYPTMPTKVPLADSFGWIGMYSAFKKAGFKIVDRTSKNRPMVRFNVE